MQSEEADQRQRQAVHSIYERIETHRSETRKLARVADPTSQRAQKVRGAHPPSAWHGRGIEGVPVRPT